jgi:GNAT superfamily N-acetyltransferase
MYEELLIEAFPPAETTPLDVLQRSLTVTPPLARVAVTVQGTPRERPSSDGAGKLVAAVVGDLFPASRVLLISYLVVHPDMRGRGIGSATLSRVLPIWFEQHRPLATLAEVEDPRVHPARPGQDPAGRLRLYGRLGARILDIPYMQPEINRGHGRVRDLFLLASPAHSLSVHGAEPALDADLVETFLTEYFASAEGVSEPDAELTVLLKAVRCRPLVPLIPTCRYGTPTRAKWPK